MAQAPIKDRTTELVAVWVYPTYTKKGSAKVCVYEDEEMMLTVMQNLCRLSAYDLACYCYLDYRPVVYETMIQADGHEHLLLLKPHITKKALRKLIGTGWHPCDTIRTMPVEDLPPYPGLV
ncbi:unnamed protein product [marine sediment metagenome]|uniref:Uncharacterized protein n=1 Tax=marine sediment metagenome TaxID=412755 RepID=X1A7X7_9ZZZZ